MPKTQNKLNKYYRNGIGIPKDEEKAFQWYMKSAERRYSVGQFNLEITKDEKKAFRWYMKSTKGGYHKEHYNLGYFYYNGIGTAKDEKKAFQSCNTKDEEKAFQWYLKSAEGGNRRNSGGQYSLVNCYKDEKKALSWCEII
ncbi:hypothetical protein Glove_219g80 [Diversispora epigaea]|uniref:Uncharacterized protein n=1 Tax=Diversispora epigaea TaxID=1348612 RepID=A0A397IFV4_9GLOM|nr:hypothetical protein Glove_219g80 [Diversispora epigaea]